MELIKWLLPHCVHLIVALPAERLHPLALMVDIFPVAAHPHAIPFVDIRMLSANGTCPVHYTGVQIPLRVLT